MSKYTTELRYLVETEYDFGLNDYPIFDENYREVLNNKIVNHYYMREIGFETAGLFKLYFTSKMNEIMPRYNILYQKQQELLNSKDMFGNVDLHEDSTRTVDSSGNSNSWSDSSNNVSSKNLFQDTPQGELDITDIENQRWATDLTFNNSNGTSNIHDASNTAGNSTDHYVRSFTGNNGKKYNVEIYNEIVNSIQNIDLLIINELNELFMGIY